MKFELPTLPYVIQDRLDQIRERLDEFVALPLRRQVSIAAGIALMFHFALLVIGGIWLTLNPSEPFSVKDLKEPLRVVLKLPDPPAPAPLPPEQELQLQELFEALPPKIQKHYIDVTGLAKAKNLSKAALLESWADSIAGSDKAGIGDSPLPSQDGRDDRIGIHFKNQQVSIGETGESPGAAGAPSQPPAPVPPVPPNPTQVAMAVVPKNLLRVPLPNDQQIALFLSAPREEPIIEPKTKPPEPAAKPPEPKDLPKTEPPKPEEIAPATEPAISEPPPPRKTEPSTIIATKPATPTSGYNPQLEKTKILGGNLPKGANGVDAVATLEGRYKKNVNMAVGSRWNFYLKERGSLIQTGMVEVSFSINAKGKLVNFHVEENSSNAAHAAMIEQCFREAEFDAPPPQLLKDGIYEDVFRFAAY